MLKRSAPINFTACAIAYEYSPPLPLRQAQVRKSRIQVLPAGRTGIYNARRGFLPWGKVEPHASFPTEEHYATSERWLEGKGLAKLPWEVLDMSDEYTTGDNASGAERSAGRAGIEQVRGYVQECEPRVE
jgi:hypothetical protein